MTLKTKPRIACTLLSQAGADVGVTDLLMLVPDETVA